MSIQIIALIQARTGSSRMPNKTIQKILGKEVFVHVHDRVKQSKLITDIVVITSTNNNDDVISNLCTQNNIKCFRGSELDCLDRHYQAATEYNANYILKIPSDSPFCDSDIIDKVIQKCFDCNAEFASNLYPSTYPDGLDVEVCHYDTLRRVWLESNKSYEREHTFPYVWENREKFNIVNVENDCIKYKDKYQNMYMTHRWTLDYQEDFDFINKVYNEFISKPNFRMNDIFELLEQKPELMNINKQYAGINWYRNHEGELKTIPRYMYKTTKKLNLTKSIALLQESLKIIPCATQTLSKGYTQWSVGACPLFVDSAKGCEVIDVDGNKYIDYGMGLGPFILGYSDDDINAAVSKQLEKGTMFTLPHHLEVEAANVIIDVVPCAEMVRFGKNGSDVTSAAVRLARAYTKRDKIICCGYHGFQDWYIITTERHHGIPQCLKELTISVKYNNIDRIKEIITENPNEIACIILEPASAVGPIDGFLEKLRKLTTEHGIVLIFDELFTGFRWSIGGASQYFNVIPDLACFGKAISNGLPSSCIVGKRDIMSKFEDVFFSFTYGGEVLSLTAIITTICKLKELNVSEYIEEKGNYMISEIKHLIIQNNLHEYLDIIGFPFKSVFNFIPTNNYTSLEMKTYFQQECAKQGILFIGYHLISYSHTQEHIDYTLSVYNNIMQQLHILLTTNTLIEHIEGTVVTQIFKNVGDRSSN
jgi:glutamate-1-semialdehyde aminotransferase/spore coat polysaccharide biosynthesis protein SpsF (cytidylyltransferase family)